MNKLAALCLTITHLLGAGSDSTKDTTSHLPVVVDVRSSILISSTNTSASSKNACINRCGLPVECLFTICEYLPKAELKDVCRTGREVTLFESKFFVVNHMQKVFSFSVEVLSKFAFFEHYYSQKHVESCEANKQYALNEIKKALTPSNGHIVKIGVNCSDNFLLALGLMSNSDVVSKLLDDLAIDKHFHKEMLYLCSYYYRPIDTEWEERDNQTVNNELSLESKKYMLIDDAVTKDVNLSGIEYVIIPADSAISQEKIDNFKKDNKKIELFYLINNSTGTGSTGSWDTEDEELFDGLLNGDSFHTAPSEEGSVASDDAS